MINLRLGVALGLISSVAAPLSAQITTFKAGEPARASEVNANFVAIKSVADAAAAASAAATAATAALQNRTDITGANVVDGSLTAADIGTNIVSSVDGVISDGGDIDLVAGTGVTITPNPGGKNITIAATPFNGGSITDQLTINRTTGSTGTLWGLRSYVYTKGVGYGIWSIAGLTSDPGVKYAVIGQAYTSSGNSYGIYGSATASTAGSAYGVYGIRGSTGTSHYSIYSSGNLGSSGSKSFIQPHPKDAGKVIDFVSLEGNESGTYFRGTTRLRGGVAEIDIPEAWKFVTAKEKLTVHLTPIRSLARLAVWDKTREKITVRGDEDCEFDYLVHGLRRGFENHQVVKPNAGEFKPEILGIPYGQEYSRSYRNLLVENGTLNSDYTPNVQTAQKRGWVLREPTEEEITKAVANEVTWQATQRMQEANANRVK